LVTKREFLPIGFQVAAMLGERWLSSGITTAASGPFVDVRLVFRESC
jgi:hypothetical protein